ncbi:MAG: 2-amino-4-hydroxy-6-hydroxymethyldihydropteridine diphosphokinase [Candidatus Eisenbacteria bacterium]|nr:2-amino-4-hydroxy-6-hydroxymethyldihydropteridine diphosphokinase [Candidatus Eisenbacteria bacterium]
MRNVFIGLGSNLGEREASLKAAIEMLSKLPQTLLIRVSSLYDTAPVGELDQPNFLNAVAIIETGLSPRKLLWNLLLIEKRLGRTRQKRWGPRVIDLDILFYGNLIVEEADLIIPHPEIEKRAFVLVPASELEPEFIHPRKGETLSQLLKRLDLRSSSVKRKGRLWF